MRILFEIKALSDQMVGQADYHKLQGFIYSKLINSTSFKDIHDNKLSYKYFSYSNIFPPSSVKMGQSRYFLFASPDNAVTNKFATKPLLWPCSKTEQQLQISEE